MLPELFLGLHMDLLLKSNREFGVRLGSKITANSSLGLVLSSGSVEQKFDSLRSDGKFDSKSFDLKYDMQTLFYRYQFLSGWFVNFNLMKREAHESIGLVTRGETNSDAIPSFNGRMDIDAESYLLGLSFGYEFVSNKKFFFDLTIASYAVPVMKRSRSTLELTENSNTNGMQVVIDAADRFARELAEKDEFGLLKISAGMKF